MYLCSQIDYTLKFNKLILLTVALLLSTITMAEVVVLNTGTRIQGEIILQNEEVVIIKKKDGTRYQYPRSEVASIQEETTTQTVAEETLSPIIIRPVAIRVQVSGGAVYLPIHGWGGQVGADLQIGSREIAGKPIFVGGSIGFRSKILPEESYTFIPLQVAVSSALTTKRHAPYVGMNIGYGFSTDEQNKGGISLSAYTGWTYHINDNTSVLLSCFAEWQQATVQTTEIINNQSYTNNIGCNFVSIGANVTIEF